MSSAVFDYQATRDTDAEAALLRLVFTDDRERLVSELVDSEHQLARDLAAVRKLLHLTLGLLHESGRKVSRLREQHRQLLDEYRGLREKHRRLSEEHRSLQKRLPPDEPEVA